MAISKKADSRLCRRIVVSVLDLMTSGWADTTFGMYYVPPLLVSARMTSHLTNNVRSFCKLSHDTSRVSSSKTPEESETPLDYRRVILIFCVLMHQNALIKKIDAGKVKPSSESDVESPEDEPA
ncbi:uncharacterized protein [Rutidosis leptorrhynchoides]|uniref:uncharacterized protein n=1 Tax=Rutidosis leptorrhynchoides TaxID=125765 RepID=UPI003A995A3C